MNESTKRLLAELTGIAAVSILAVLFFGVMFFTGFFNWKYQDHQVLQGVVIEKTISPDTTFTQQQCDFIWFGCEDVESNYRLTLVYKEKTRYVVVDAQTFENYQLGGYYP